MNDDIVRYSIVAEEFTASAEHVAKLKPRVHVEGWRSEEPYAVFSHA